MVHAGLWTLPTPLKRPPNDKIVICRSLSVHLGPVQSTRCPLWAKHSNYEKAIRPFDGTDLVRAARILLRGRSPGPKLPFLERDPCGRRGRLGLPLSRRESASSVRQPRNKGRSN